MTKEKEHPHAKTLRAIADGQQMQKKFAGIEHAWIDTDNQSILSHLYATPDSWEFRIKPRPMCTLGGVEFPLPIQEAPAPETEVWSPDITDPEEPFCYNWDGYGGDTPLLKANLLQYTREGAIAQGHAMAAALQQAIEGAK